MRSSIAPTCFNAPESVSVVAGERRIFYGQINAVDGFVPERGTVELESAVGGPDLELSVGDLRHGRIQLRLDAAEGSANSERRVLLVLSWSRSSGGVGRLAWPLKVQVLAEKPAPSDQPKVGGGTKGKGRSRSRVALIWSTHAEQQDRGWTETTAGDLQQVTGRVLAESDPEEYRER